MHVTVFLEPGGQDLRVWEPCSSSAGDPSRQASMGPGLRQPSTGSSEGGPAQPRKAGFPGPQAAARLCSLWALGGHGEATPPLVPRPLPLASCSLTSCLSLLRASLGILTVDEVPSL